MKLIIILGSLLALILISPYVFAAPMYDGKGNVTWTEGRVAPMYDNDGNVTWIKGR